MKTIKIEKDLGTPIQIVGTSYGVDIKILHGANAVALATAIFEHVGEWVSVKDTPPAKWTIAWVKRGNHVYDMPYIFFEGKFHRIPFNGKESEMEYQPESYQPIPQPKP
jgi:hypothetical protein